MTIPTPKIQAIFCCSNVTFGCFFMKNILKVLLWFKCGALHSKGIGNFVFSNVILTLILLLYLDILTNRERKQNRNGILCALVWVKHYTEALSFTPFLWGTLKENAFLVPVHGTSQPARDIVLLVDILTCHFAFIFWFRNCMLEVKVCACVCVQRMYFWRTWICVYVCSIKV